MINTQQETSVGSIGVCGEILPFNKVTDKPISTECQRVSPVEICIRCSKSRKIYAKNLCNSCYSHLHLNREKHKINLLNWRIKHPNYFKEYYLKHKKDG
jgi:uncharacterized paraquat-inducible protein A